MHPCRILLADGNPRILGAVAQFLGDYPEIEVIGSTCSGCEALVLVTLLRPDLVVMDLTMPEVSGLKAASLLAAEPGAPRIILMTIHDEEEYRLAAEAAGADGFLQKMELVTHLIPLIKAIIATASGRTKR